MATRSHIGFRNSDNTIDAVYCHWDGYPSNMVEELDGFIQRFGIDAFKKRIKTGQAENGFSSWDNKGGVTHEEKYPGRDEKFDYSESDRARFDNDYAYILSGENGSIVEFYSFGNPIFIIPIENENDPAFYERMDEALRNN